ncbi:MAG: hypothetical protein ACRELF_00455 [Gemmataceae bacterium]
MKRFLARRWYLLLGMAVVLGFLALFRQEVFAFIDRLANTASVLGLLVSIIGFVLTLWTVYETQRASRQAQNQIEKEVAAARRETQQAVEKIALQLLQAECEGIYRLLMEPRRAIRDGQWVRAAERCQEAKQGLVHLGAYRHLDRQEKESFATGADDLQATIAFIERNRLKPNPPAGLPDDKLQPLDTALTQLERTRSRLLQLFLEIPYANQS